jgi:hypothetical protein
MRRASKAHVCGECNCEIVPGEKYELTSSVMDGDWYRFKTCQLCRRIRNDLLCGWTYGEVWEHIHELYGVGLEVDNGR